MVGTMELEFNYRALYKALGENREAWVDLNRLIEKLIKDAEAQRARSGAYGPTR